MTIDPTRRALLGGGALAVLAAALPARALAAMATAPAWQGGWRELAPGVFAAIAAPKDGAPVEAYGNAGLLVGGQTPMAIDSTGDPAFAAQFMDKARGATGGKPIGHVILTSQHNGFVAGLPGLAAAQIVSHENCRAAMKGMGAKFRPVLPNCTLSDGALYIQGARTVRVFPPMKGAAATEMAVHIPEARVLYTGCLAGFGVVPDARTARFAEWIATIDSFIALDPAYVVPGYGPVGGVAELKTFKGYLERVVAEGRKAKAAGASAGKAAAMADLGPYAEWHAAEAMRVPTMVRLYHELAGDAGANPDMAGERAAREEYVALRGAAAK